jgi:hypothetical protein
LKPWRYHGGRQGKRSRRAGCARQLHGFKMNPDDKFTPAKHQTPPSPPHHSSRRAAAHTGTETTTIGGGRACSRALNPERDIHCQLNFNIGECWSYGTMTPPYQRPVPYCPRTMTCVGGCFLHPSHGGPVWLQCWLCALWAVLAAVWWGGKHNIITIVCLLYACSWPYAPQAEGVLLRALDDRSRVHG